MNKSQLIELLSKKEGITIKAAEEVVTIFIEAIEQGLVEGDRAEIRGFGSFKVKTYPGYTGRNPKSGEIIEVKTKKLPFFKVGKELKDRVDIHEGDDNA